LVWIPKYRKKVLYDHLRKDLGEQLRELARRQESQILEGHLKGDHIHMLISIPPKYAVSQVVGYIKGKSAIHISPQLFREAQEFYRSTFLGQGLLCVNRWTR